MTQIVHDKNVVGHCYDLTTFIAFCSIEYCKLYILVKRNAKEEAVGHCKDKYYGV